MGTRADFYVGKGKTAEWLGSIAWDGYRDGIDADLLDARSERVYREKVAAFLTSRDDATMPDRGWPWPWDDSATTDCSYWYADGVVYDEFDGYLFSCQQDMPDLDADGWQEGRERIEFPDMSSRKNVTFGKRSGVIILGS